MRTFVLISTALMLMACADGLEDFPVGQNASPPADVHDAAMPMPPEPPAAPEIIQDDQDAFAGFEMLSVPEDLQKIFMGQNQAMLAVMEEFNLRPLANEEGVKARAQLRTSEEGQTTWEYEIDRLPDDSVKAVAYKAYFEDVPGGIKIALLGKRIQCYRGENPGEWTTGLCP